jgi:hypothetical protein
VRGCVQRVSEISTLILTSNSSRQEQQNFYVSFFRNIIFISVFPLRGMLERVEESFRRRRHYCIDNNGGHFEHFL